MRRTGSAVSVSVGRGGSGNCKAAGPCKGPSGSGVARRSACVPGAAWRSIRRRGIGVSLKVGRGSSSADGAGSGASERGTGSFLSESPDGFSRLT